MSTTQPNFALNTMQVAFLNSGLIQELLKPKSKPVKFRRMQHKGKIVGYRRDVLTGERVTIVARTSNYA